MNFIISLLTCCFQLVFLLANDEGKFAIDDNGVITLISSLDRETTDSYNLTVTVRDQGQPSNSATTYVYVMVEDVNDVVPAIDAVREHFK